jgi:hypothetical protein
VKEGTTGEIWEIIQSVKTVSVYHIFENDIMKVLVSLTCCDSFEGLPYSICSEQRE